MHLPLGPIQSESDWVCSTLGHLFCSGLFVPVGLFWVSPGRLAAPRLDQLVCFWSVRVIFTEFVMS